MTKHILTALSLMTTCGLAMAAPRTLHEARQIAAQELAARLGHDIELTAQPQRALSRGDQAQDPEALPYYHFSEGNAFVIIAGSDLLPAVIGYGTGTDIDPTQPLPPNMLDWLDQVTEAEQYLEANPAAAQAQRAAMVTSEVEPIARLMTCQWGQDAPYYDYCPVVNGRQTVVGCMATAMSQIIYTQRFPAMSHGSVEYKTMGQTIQADLEGVTYDYDKMLARYGNAATDEQKAEVAKLCYNVGIASKMQYGDMSGTISYAALTAAIRHFGMTKAAFLHRYYYTLDEWNEIIQTELRAGNPVLFAAQSDEGGHAFVLDGMDSKGFYHVNWGWEGYCDGYFDVSLLRSSGAGTGATVNSGFCLGQEMIVNLCDPDKVSRWHNPLGTYHNPYYPANDNITCSPSTGIKPGSTVTLSAYIANYSCELQVLRFGVMVMKDDEVVARQMNASPNHVYGGEAKVGDDGSFWIESGMGTVSASFTLPPDIEDGTYRLYLITQLEGSEEEDIVRQHHVRANYWTMRITDGVVRMSHPVIGIPMEVTAWSFDSEPVSTGPSQITCTVVNTGEETMAVRYYLRLTQPDGKRTDFISMNNDDSPVTTAPGESSTLTFSINATQPGKYKAGLAGLIMGLDTEQKIDFASGEFEMEADPTRSAVLTLAEAPTIVSETVTNGQELTMKLRVTNTGADYDGKMSIRLFSRSSSTADSYLKAELTNDAVRIRAGETAVVTITGTLDIPSMTKNTALYARGFYLYGDEMRQFDGNKCTTVRVYAATGIAEVTVDQEADDLRNAAIYDVLGKRVTLPASGQLKPGIYIINGRKRVFN